MSPTPGAYSNSCPLSWWGHPTISSSVVPWSSCIQSFPASGSFPMNQFFIPGGQSIGVSASASVLPMNIHDWFPLELTSWISLQSKELSRVFSSTTVQNYVLQCSAFFMVQLSHPYMTTGKTMAFTRWNFVGKVMSLLFNIQSQLVIAFLPRRKCLLISWLQSPPAVILEPKEINYFTVSIASPSICHVKWDWMPWSLSFECWVLSQLFHSSLSLSSRGSLSSLLSAIRVVSSAYLRLLTFLPTVLIPACVSSNPPFCLMSSAY